MASISTGTGCCWATATVTEGGAAPGGRPAAAPGAGCCPPTHPASHTVSASAQLHTGSAPWAARPMEEKSPCPLHFDGGNGVAVWKAGWGYKNLQSTLVSRGRVPIFG